ncbi:hypothetical protein SAMN04487886_100150 [Clostridium sp. DSM 8431]|uniref:hypothetical protein n=1 Tax=Clostridium sp. DSM 8431 TaxID=1761781 RepID=UPI0008E33B92|nr:hypothetical protein [Clostridium sp. DSM 8431]SFU28575.1 hypothetical protein SAMN04487886_100150 [Clostridium sp. DSM 8431]
MKCFVGNKLLVFIVSMCFVLFVSCESDIKEKVEGIKLSTGAVIQNDSGELSNFNLLDGNYTKIDNSEVVGVYNSKSGNYVGIKDGEYEYFYDGIIRKLENIDINSTDLKLSKSGDYLSYFENEDGVLELKLKSLKDDSNIEFNSHVYISSTLMDWIDNENIVYYGISEEKVNGIFIYNVSTKEEKLLYELNNGIIQFVKTIDDGVLCIQETVDGKKLLKVIEQDGKSEKIISEKVTQIIDIIMKDNEYYFIGKVLGEAESIYKLSNNQLKRMVFDFPKVIDFNKGLSVDSEGDILFIGKNNIKDTGEEIYKVNSKGTISKIKDKAKEYTFVDF